MNVAIDEANTTSRNVTHLYVTEHWVGKLERGKTRWPHEERRAALRRVLGAATDAEVGLYSMRLTDAGYDPEWDDGDIDRRTVLRAGVLGAAQVHAALTVVDLAHLVAAVQDAHRYLDHDIVGHLRERLGACTAADGTHGPNSSLPVMLGLLGVVERHAMEVKPGVRSELLAVGARGAEFTGWLYRDLGQPALAAYWRHRAASWSSAIGDETMRAYVLLKNSQAAWDRRDAADMLELIRQVHEGPWRLPSRVRAEALQQEARGQAMASGRKTVVEDKLGEARALLLQQAVVEQADHTGLAEHYDQALLGVQTAMCYRENGQIERARALYERWLSPKVFSRRDYGYFLALKAETIAVDGDPDAAAEAGTTALAIAAATDSIRSLGELRRLAGRLAPRSSRPAVAAYLHAFGAELDLRRLRQPVG
ncbi:hypothetical protein [Dactylosporangium sp. CA-092794]|uniref:hypothetical protein n=1 Tax=Dactylosporangium sp. CA-092794 TaxID=3239929 RepID=UPI003D9365E6